MNILKFIHVLSQTPPLVELLAIRLGYQKTIAKSLVMPRGGREGF
jgi:hypothetical protein